MDFYSLYAIISGLINAFYIKEAAADYCLAGYYSSAYTVYCATSCCGYYYARTCCPGTEVNVGGIIGGIVACITIIVIIIVVIIVIKKIQQRTRVTAISTGAPAMTVVNTSNQQQMGGYGHPGPAYGQPAGYGQPAEYGQPVGYGQPAGYGHPGYVDPAYPPKY